jgi:hypothetical protein
VDPRRRDSPIGDRREVLSRAAPYLVAALAFGLAFLAVYALLVSTEAGQRLENLALQGAALRSAEDFDQSLGTLVPISVATFGMAVAIVAFAGIARGRLALGALAASVMVVAVGGAEVLKELLPRPEHIEGPRWLLRNSFPSGTAAVASAVAVGALLVAPDRLRWIVLVIGSVGVGVIAQALQVVGWHRLSDVFGSALLVAAVASAGVALLAGADLTAPTGVGRVHPRLYRALVVGAAAVMAVGAVMLVLLVAFPLLSSPEGGKRVFLQTAFPLFATGLTVVTLTLVARLIESRTLGRRPPPRATEAVTRDEVVSPPADASAAGPRGR